MRVVPGSQPTAYARPGVYGQRSRDGLAVGAGAGGGEGLRVGGQVPARCTRRAPRATMRFAGESYSWKVRPNRGCPLWWTLRVAPGDCSSERWSTGSTTSSGFGAVGSCAAVRDSMTSPAPRINPSDRNNPAAVKPTVSASFQAYGSHFPSPVLARRAPPGDVHYCSNFRARNSVKRFLLVFWTRQWGKWLHGGATRRGQITPASVVQCIRPPPLAVCLPCAVQFPMALSSAPGGLCRARAVIPSTGGAEWLGNGWDLAMGG